MSIIVIFSDLHAHGFKPYATILPNGMHSRLADAVNCISQIYDYSVAIKADAVLFGGDLFHVRKTISVAAFNAVYEQMSRFATAHIPVTMIHGNHDQADRDGTVHSIHAFRSFLDVIDHPGWNQIRCVNTGETVHLLAVPYIENLLQLREIVNTSCPSSSTHKMMLAHLGIQGALIGSDFVYPNPFDAAVSDLNVTAFDSVYLGHFHLHQQLAPNAWYIGAPLQHNWGDRKDQQRGFLVYDTETGTHERVQLKAPKFVEVLDTEQYNNTDDNFIRIVSTRKWDESEREECRLKLGARSVEITPPKFTVDKTVAPRFEVDPSQSSEEILEKYVLSGMSNLDGLDENYLIQMGRDIMREVEESQ